MKRNIVVAMTGASGSPYAVRLIDILIAAGCDVHLTISRAATDVLKQELNLDISLDEFQPSMLRLENKAASQKEAVPKKEVASQEAGTIHYHHYCDFFAPIASGSFLTDGMVICPCSGGALSSIVHGTTANLIHRAADVHLKERRRLILVPRETPLSLIQLENLKRAAEAGAIVLPAMPGFYHGVSTVQDLVDFIVARICDQLGVANTLIRRWGM